MNEDHTFKAGALLLGHPKMWRYSDTATDTQDAWTTKGWGLLLPEYLLLPSKPRVLI